jgi:hypothetical protein
MYAIFVDKTLPKFLEPFESFRSLQVPKCSQIFESLLSSSLFDKCNPNFESFEFFLCQNSARLYHSCDSVRLRFFQVSQLAKLLSSDIFEVMG